MNSQRLKTLLEFQKKEPDDPFLLYAIGMEYLKKMPAKAKAYFEKLLDKHPDYLPTYYQAAQLSISSDDFKRALDLLKQGMIIAKQQNDLATHKELKDLYAYVEEEFENL